MQKYSIILLDFDGTIANSRKAIAFSMKGTFRHFGLQAPEEQDVQYAIQQGWIAEKSFRFLMPDGDSLTEEQLQEMKEAYRQVYLNEGYKLTEPFEGVQEIVPQLHNSGRKVAIVSNKAAGSIEKTISMWKLNSYIDFMIADESCATKRSVLKPEIACFDERVAPLYKSEKDQFLMVGDTATDLQFAKNCGISSCWASYGFGSNASCEAIQPSYTIQTFPEILSLV